jgi:hypothetical protein
MEQELTTKEDMLEIGITRYYEKDGYPDVSMKMCEICGDEFNDTDIRTATIDDEQGEVCIYCLDSVKAGYCL